MHFLSYLKRRHDAQITWPHAYYITLGSPCKMANSSSKDETDTLPKRPTRIQPYQFEPVRQDFERVPEHCVSFDMRYSMGFAKSHKDTAVSVWACQAGFWKSTGTLCQLWHAVFHGVCKIPQGYSRISLSLSGRILKEYRNIVSALTCGIPWGLQNCTRWSARYTNGRDVAQQESQLVWIV